MSSLNDMFFSDASGQQPYEEILADVQKFCTAHCASVLASQKADEAEQSLRQAIMQRIREKHYALEELDTGHLANRLYEDMAGYSFLRKWIEQEGIEEVNVNAWNDIEVIYQSGRSVKIPEKFTSPQQAIDVVRRMLSSCGMIIDDAMPSVLGHLDKNIRISADKTPLVDPEVGINVSIRVINQQTVSREKLLQSGSATQEMLDFLTSCVRYGVSVCIAGATGSGKTTLMAWLLSTVPDHYRLITIEDGSREFNLVKRDADGNIQNSVVHLLTRPSENPVMNIDQDFLLERVLRKHPNIIGVGEIRAAAEAMSVAEASRTGHTCVTTVHANSAAASYRRMMTLAKRQIAIADDMLMQIMVEAFPVVVYTRQMEDGSRKILEVIEGEGYEDGHLQYRRLYGYDIQENRREEAGTLFILGSHWKGEPISRTLRRRLLEGGIPKEELKKFAKEEE